MASGSSVSTSMSAMDRVKVSSKSQGEWLLNSICTQTVSPIKTFPNIEGRTSAMVSWKASGGYAPGKWGRKPRMRMGSQAVGLPTEVKSPRARPGSARLSIFYIMVAWAFVANLVFCRACHPNPESQLLRRAWDHSIQCPPAWQVRKSRSTKSSKSKYNQEKNQNPLARELWLELLFQQDPTFNWPVNVWNGSFTFFWPVAVMVVPFSDVHMHLEPRFG